MVIAEDLRQLAQQGDLTSAAIRGAQMMAEAQVLTETEASQLEHRPEEMM